MEILYEVNPDPTPTSSQILSLYRDAGILFPNWTEERMDRALASTSLLVCARENRELIGVARVITDFAWVAYLTQLAVSPRLQKRGIGTRLLEIVKEKIGPEVALVLHSADNAKAFYEAVGFSPYSDVYRIPREK